MATLKADIEKLDEALNILYEILPQFDDLRYDVNNIASELNSTWEGAASDYFIGKLRNHIRPLHDTQKALEYFMEYAADAKYNMQKLDEICQIISSSNFIPTVPIQQPTSSTTNTNDSISTQNGGGKTTSSSSNKKTASSSKKDSSKKESKNVIEKAIDVVTSGCKAIVNGFKTLLGGK